MKTSRLLLGILIGLMVPGLGMALVSTGVLQGPGAIAEWLSGGTAMQLAMLVVALILILAISRGRPAVYGFRMPSAAQARSALLWGSIAAVITHVVLAVLWTFLSPSAGHPGLKGDSFLHTVVSVWIIASICEEVVYRGLVQGFLEPLRAYGLNISRVRLSLPVIIAALLFGGIHLMLLTTGAGGMLVGGIVGSAAVLGLVAGYYREKSGSLVPAVLIHMLFNIYGSASAYIQNR
ncbi:MAG: CPBP family intramembrane metalloprotease [bacterium]